MSRPNVAVLAGWITDHQGIQSKISSQTKFPGLTTTSITYPLLQNTRVLKSNLGQYVGRKAAPLGTSKDLAGLFRISLPIANRMGLTGDMCTGPLECADGRICTNGEITTCPSGEACFCAPSDGGVACTSSADCSTDGEVCVQLNAGTVCFSEETATAEGIPIVGSEPTDGPGASSSSGDDDPSTTGEIDFPSSSNESDGNEPPCIDARALGHLSTNRLVFEKHAVSRVLCDENSSCATRGHMVVFRGHAMRMSTYCDSVGCKEAVMEVNNPRFNRGMRIESKTKGLEYTVFAARYDTQAEESLIRMVVRLGL